jgi:hypothetical protein
MKTIRLYHPHTHEGIAYTPSPEGIELTVNDADAALLAAWGLTTPLPALDVAPIASTDATPQAHDRATTDRHIDAPEADAASDDEQIGAHHEDTDA